MSVSVSVSNKMMSMLSAWESEIVRDTISRCAEKYGFSVEEALREFVGVGVSVSKVKLVKEKKVKEVSIPLPFNNVVKEGCCHGLEWNHGLLTQCGVCCEEGVMYCSVHEKECEYGTIEERMSSDAVSYVSRNGKRPVAYVKVMKKLKLIVG